MIGQELLSDALGAEELEGLPLREAELSFRALVCLHLSELMRYPEADGEPAGAARALAALFVEGSREHELSTQAARAADEASLLDLQRDYTALFIGALEMAAAPFASFWLDDARQLGGPTTVAVEQAYRDFGMRLEQQRKQPGDHLSVMLEFLFIVLRDAACAAQAGDRPASTRLAAQAQEFFESYVAPWVCDMCGLVVAHAKTDFYRDVAELVSLVLVEDSLLAEAAE